MMDFPHSVYVSMSATMRFVLEAGLMLGDKVIAVDNGAINTDIMSVASGKLEKYIQQADGLTLEIERNGKILMFDIAKERKPTQ